MRRLTHFISGLTVLIAVISLIALTIAVAPAQETTNVTISAPNQVVNGMEFSVRLDITDVVDIDTYRVDISYDPSVIEVIGVEGGEAGVSPGLIGSTQI